ncbi:MAG: PQQ-binding-like beta-propeller repeat protein [Candidatus Bipolaricaulota bacterium]|nr:PQQ-binding-like beta-propeller repeat protein [Candidatus Bipolaricaulota bacterium]
MLEAFARSRTAQYVRGASSIVCLAVVLVFGGLAVSGADISVESLQIGLVEGAATVDRSALGLDQGIIGDTVRVSALVRNDGTTAVGEFDVDFFFTEIISGEHGRLGTQVVSGLEPGESKRPVIVFDTSAYSPGIYVFSAEADPRDALGDTDPCDNVAPRAACSGTSVESADKYSITLLREGRHISQLTVRDPFPLCRMGRLQTSLTVDVYNVGTEALSGSDLAVYGYYRLGLNPPANEFVPLVADASGNPVQLAKIASFGTPGKAGSIVITLNYDVFARLFAPNSTARDSGEVLGRANPVQIRITVQSADGSGTAQDLFLPAQFELSQFYSTADLWAFPARATCCSGNCTAVTSVAVVPAVAGGLVFHVARDATGETMHVLKIRTGEEKGTWSAPSGKTLTSPVATYDASTDTYRVYVGASDGRIYALDGADKDEGTFLTGRWQSAAADTVVKGDTYLVLSSDRAKLVVGSESGAFILDAETGLTLRKVTTHAPVTSAPAYVVATGTLWIAADEVIYGIPASGSESTVTVNERVTTDLWLNARETALLYGTQSGYLYALDPTAKSQTGTQLATLYTQLRSIVGMSLVSRDDDAVLFVASDIGDMARVEYDQGRGFRNLLISTRLLEPSVIAAAPAVLANAAGDDAAVVFVSGERRDGRTTRPVLQGWDRRLEQYENVTVWGTAVPFLFKPEEEGTVPAALLRPIVDPETFTLLVASSDGYLYAFDLSQFE